MNNFKLELKEGEPTKAEKQVLVEGMLKHHSDNGHPRKVSSLSIWLKDDEDKKVGGVIASFLWNGMEIEALWVDEKLRGKGWGAKLLKAIEEEAKKRNCTIFYTNTFPWQAPEFYESQGYKLYGKLDGFPEGSYLSYYYKKLR